jgi:hypothetical protein
LTPPGPEEHQPELPDQVTASAIITAKKPAAAAIRTFTILMVRPFQGRGTISWL